MPSPFGVNVLSQYVRDRMALLNWIIDANPMAVVAMDDASLTQQIRALLPNSVVIHRAYHPADHRMWEVVTPQDWLAAHIGFAANGVCLQTLNEPTLNHAALAWLEELCRICPAHVRLALPNFGVGNPHERDILAGKYDRLLRLVCGTRHILSVHEYFQNDPSAEVPYLCGRFAFWQRRARVLGLPEPRIILTEHGRDVGGGRRDGWQDTGWGERGYFDRLVEAQEAVYANRMPVAIFCWGTGAANHWLSFDIQDSPTLQRLLVEWNAAHPIQEQPVTDLTPLGQYRLAEIPASYINVRAAPNVAAPDIGDLRVGDVVTLYTPEINGWVNVEKGALRGWTSLQNGAVKFIPASAVPFRLQNPVGCAHVITSKFGTPRDYDGDGIYDDIHEGLDVAPAHADCTPLILNGADGVVMDVSTTGAYGNHVVVSSVVGGQEFRVWLCHMAQMFVAKGQQVRTGDPIGVMGSSGNSTGTHLHLAVQKIGAPTPPGSPLASVIDPLPLIEWN